MKIQAIGTGGAFSKKYGNTSIFINTGDFETSLLFDMGRNIIEQAEKVNLDLLRVRNVYISHMHSDHTGSLPDWALLTYFIPTIQKPRLFANHQIVRQLWSNYLASMLGTLAEGQLPSDKKEATIHDYFVVNSIANNRSFRLGEIEYMPLQTTHVMNGYSLMESFGLIFEANGKRILLTGDTQFNPEQLKLSYSKSDIIIQDCETSEYPSGVHAHLKDLKTLPNEIKEKMYLVHYGDNIDKTTECSEFRGFLFPGDSIEI